MKKIILVYILITLTACTSAYHHRPVQDQAVGGVSFLDMFTGRDRVGVITKQAHYDIFISRPIPSGSWTAFWPILSIFDKPIGYEICQAPPADAIASIASSFAATAAIEGKTKNDVISGEAEGTINSFFANKIKAVAFRTQGLQYLRDIRFDNCIAWQNRGILSEADKKLLKERITISNKDAEIEGVGLIYYELMLRAMTNNFGTSEVEVSKEAVQAVTKISKAKIEELKNSKKTETPPSDSTTNDKKTKIEAK